MQTLIKFYNFVKELNLDNSRLYKISVLESHKEDEDIKYYLNFVYNPYIVTGVSEKKYNKELSGSAAFIPSSMRELLEYLKIHNTGSSADTLVLQGFLKSHEAEYAEIEDKEAFRDLYKRIVTKNLQLGIDSKTINKVIPNLIPTFSVQLANKYFEKPEAVEGKEFALTTKIDGGRIIAIKKDGQAKFFTRQGQEYEGLVDLKRELEETLPDNICLDGEITLLDKGSLNSKDQYKQTMMITRKDGEKHGVKMLVFDCMTAEEFESQNCLTPYYERRNNMMKWFGGGKSLEEINKDHTYFSLLPILYQGTDKAKITEWLNYNIAHGEEGVMINIVTAPYDFKRTSNLLKVKKMQTLDLEIIGYEEGTNSNAGKLGAFLVRYRDGNIVKVGSGYSKELREEVWKDPLSYLGKIIEVQYFEETMNQNGGISLRFPVFIDFRTDKSEPDF